MNKELQIKDKLLKNMHELGKIQVEFNANYKIIEGKKLFDWINKVEDILGEITEWMTYKSRQGTNK